uniref:Transmembrane protein n=1 Tax=Heterorhabditis bacteriophora TaxID=37862 RepID=A0A1I7WM36_HETBA
MAETIVTTHEVECREQQLEKVVVFNDRAELKRLVKCELAPGMNEVHVKVKFRLYNVQFIIIHSTILSIITSGKQALKVLSLVVADNLVEIYFFIIPDYLFWKCFAVDSGRLDECSTGRYMKKLFQSMLDFLFISFIILFIDLICHCYYFCSVGEFFNIYIMSKCPIYIFLRKVEGQ